MSEWDAAARNNPGLKAPLLPSDASRKQKPRGGRGFEGPPTSSSITSDEVIHGQAKGLKLIYEAQTEEEWANQLAEERERDILSTSQNVRKVRTVFFHI
jgi:hypothetical protein